MSRKLRRQNAKRARQTDSVTEPDALDLAGYKSLVQRGNYVAALQEIELLEKRFPNSAAVHYFAANALLSIGHLEKGLKRTEKALKIAPKNLRLLCLKAQILLLLDEATGSRAILERVLAEDPDFVQAIKLLARVVKVEGKYEDYKENLKKAWKLDSDDPGICLELSLADPALFDDKALQKIENKLSSKDTGIESKAVFQFAVGNILLSGHQDEMAFAAYREANALIRQTDRGQALHPAKALGIWQRAGISRAFFEERGAHGSPDKRQIYVLGCSRSGKSLTGSILSMYPGAKAVGESMRTARLITDFMKALNISPTDYLNTRSVAAAQSDAELYLKTVGVGNARLRIDTLPDNLWRLPMLSFWFPRTPIVFCKRNFLDLGVSIYFQYYGTGNRPLFDLYEIGQYMRAYEELMKFFEGILPNPIVWMDYDELVRAPRQMATLLYEDLGLGFDNVDFSRLEPAATQSEQGVHPIGSSDSVTAVGTVGVGIGQRFDRYLDALREGYAAPLKT